MGLEDDFLLNDADDEKTIEFIRNYLPQELKEKFSEDELYYFLDLIDEYYSESGILDVQPDADGYVDIDLEQVVEFIVKEAQKDEVGEYDPEDILFVVQGEMEYGSSLGQVGEASLRKPRDKKRVETLLHAFLLHVCVIVYFVLILLLLLKCIMFFRSIRCV